MIRGVFRPEGSRRRPYVSAFLEIPSLSIAADVAFLVDTGADSTVLAPRDIVKLQIDPSPLQAGPRSAGVGGSTPTAQAPAVLTLGYLRHVFTLRLLVPTDRAQQRALGRIPSLLGRDILSFFALFLEERTDRVLLLDPAEAGALAL
jgi:hypothetical protein